RLRARAGCALEQLRPSAALWVGLAQCAALWPGVSRSMATILGGIAVVLSLGSATSYKALSSGALLIHTYGWPPLIVGFVSAWLAAVLAVRWMVNWLNQRGLGVFGWWRLIAAALVVVWLLRAPPPANAEGAARDARGGVSPLLRELPYS